MSNAGHSGARDRSGGRAPGGRPLSKEALDAWSRSLNPNNEAWQEMLDSSSRQLDPNDGAWTSSRGDRGRR